MLGLLDDTAAKMLASVAQGGDRKIDDMGIMSIVGFLLLGIAALVTTPLAALLCGAFAWWQKKSIWRFAAEGALNGILVLPWILVMVKTRGRPVPIVALLIYLLPYAVWLGVFAAIAGGIFSIWEYTLGTDTGYVAPQANPVSAALMSVFLGCCAAVNAGTLLLSARGMYRRHRQDRTTGRLPEMTYYARPFVFSYIWLGALLILGLLVAQYMVSIGVDIQGF